MAKRSSQNKTYEVVIISILGIGIIAFVVYLINKASPPSSITTTTMTPRTTTTMVPLPKSIPTNGLTIWLDASHPSSWSAGEWKNLAPNGFGNATTFSGTWSAADLVKDAVNGMPAVYFDGTNSLATPDPEGTYSRGLTLFVVFKPFNMGASRTLVSRTDEYAEPAPFDVYNEMRLYGNQSGGHSFTTISYGNDFRDLSSDQAHVFVLRVAYDGETTTFQEWLDGVGFTPPSKNERGVVSTTNTNQGSYYADVGNQDKLVIGTRNGDYDTTYVGYIGEVIMYDRPLSDDEVSKTTIYLNRKWMRS